MSNVRENNPRNRQMAKFRLQRLQKVMKCIKYEQVLFQLKLLFKLSNTYRFLMCIKWLQNLIQTAARAAKPLNALTIHFVIESKY